jgi:hypothetical protein
MTWHDANWTVYRADNNDIRSVVAPHGSGIMVNQDPFGKTVKLSNVRKGDEIVLRSDFMRQWKGYYNGRPVPLYEKDGQIAFKAPREGAYDLTLKFPKYGLLTAISLCSLLAMFLLSRVNLL